MSAVTAISWWCHTRCRRVPHEADADNRGLVLETDGGRIRLEPLLPGAIRVTVTGRDAFLDKESPILAGMPETPASWRHELSPETVHFYTGDLQLVIRRDTCAFTWLDADGRLLTREPARGGKVIESFDVVRTVFREDGAVTARQSVDGMRYDASQAETVVDRTAYHAKLHFEWQPEEALYGGGHLQPPRALAPPVPAEHEGQRADAGVDARVRRAV